MAQTTAVISRTLDEAKKLAQHVQGHTILASPRTIRNGALRGYSLTQAITNDHRTLVNPTILAEITPCFAASGRPPRIAAAN